MLFVFGMSIHKSPSTHFAISLTFIICNHCIYTPEWLGKELQHTNLFKLLGRMDFVESMNVVDMMGNHHVGSYHG